MIKIFLFIIFAFINVCHPLCAIRDHAQIYGPRKKPSKKDKILSKLGVDRTDYTHHISAAEDFKDKYFRDDETKTISLKKVYKFYKKLKQEYEDNKNKAYETEVLERIDILKEDIKKARRKALEADVGENILTPYKLYLFPKLDEMIEALVNGQDNEEVEGILDEFIRGYIPYYNPNPFDSFFGKKINVAGMAGRVFKSPKKKKITKKVQANNLQVKNREQHNDINKILNQYGQKVEIGDFLTHADIQILLFHNYDISKLDPGPSAFWHPIDPKNTKKLFKIKKKDFPPPHAKKTFHHVMLGGFNSTKIKLRYFDEEGQLRGVKLKVGVEVYQEIATSALMRLLGFSSDRMIHKDKVTFYLGDKTFSSFESEIKQKFGQEPNVRFNYEYGIDENGERYITWRDILYEARPDDEIRIAPLDAASWDLQNRREYRAIELAAAWTGMFDLKADNVKALLVKKNNKFVPEHRIHDTGVSLGATVTFRGPDSLLNLRTTEVYGKVNLLETNVVKKKDDGVIIRWNDIMYQHRKYNPSTYFDQKWMARKIASIKKRDLAKAFAISGMPDDVVHLYTIKMMMRRNNIIKAFDLEDEFELYEVPNDLSNYSPKKFPTIKNGRIDVTAYEGKNIVPIRTTTWGSVTSELIANRNIPFAKLEHKIKDSDLKTTGQLQGGAVVLEHNWSKSASNVGPIKKATFKPGITLKPSRRVAENPQPLNTTIKNRGGEIIRSSLPYIIEDRISIAISAELTIAKDPNFPWHHEVAVRIIEKNLVHRHFADTVKDAWLKKFKLPKIIKEGKKKYSAKYLKDLETVESYYSIGLDVDLKAGLNIASSEAAIGGLARKYRRKLLYRDQFGRLHYLKEHVKRFSAYQQIGVLNQDVKFLSVAAFDVASSYQKFKGKIKDYVIGRTNMSSSKNHDHPQHNHEQAQREIRAFKKYKHDPQNAEVYLNFSRKFNGGSSRKKLGLAFVWGRESRNHYGEIEDVLPNGQERKLFQSNRYSGKHLGKKDIWDFHGTTDILVKKGKSKKTIVEGDFRAPKNFIITANNKIYARKASQKSLANIIRKLNARYSEEPWDGPKNQFFSSLKIPSKNELNEYRKIYAEIRAQVDGEYVLNKIKQIDVDDVKKALKAFFSYDSINIKQANFNYEDEPHKSDRFKNKATYHHKKIKILQKFKRLKELLEKEEDSKNYWKKVWIESRDLVHHLSSRYFGIHILKTFLNINETYENLNRGFFVYGEIQNIGAHITTLERPQGHRANQRNAGSHWGKFYSDKEKIRSVQYFLKYEDPTNRVPIYAPLMITTDEILGRLEQGQAPNESGEGI